MNYLINIDGMLYGYDDLDILKIDIKQMQPETYLIYKKLEGQTRVIYRAIELGDL
jgi:hypothetical protein